jgi:hypothetical protein
MKSNLLSHNSFEPNYENIQWVKGNLNGSRMRTAATWRQLTWSTIPVDQNNGKKRVTDAHTDQHSNQTVYGGITTTSLAKGGALERLSARQKLV